MRKKKKIKEKTKNISIEIIRNENLRENRIYPVDSIAKIIKKYKENWNY